MNNLFDSPNWIAFWTDVKDWYTPMECPKCGSDHVRIRIDRMGNADPVKCDICRWDDYSPHIKRLEEI